MATAEFSKFAGILNAALSQHRLLGFETAPLEFHHPDGLVVKNLLANVGDMGSIPGLGRSLREGNGNPLHYSCLRNPMDRGACWAIVHGIAESETT